MMAVVIAGARVDVMTTSMAGTMTAHVVTALAIAMMAAAKKPPVASRIRSDRRHREGGDYNNSKFAKHLFSPTLRGLGPLVAPTRRGI